MVTEDNQKCRKVPKLFCCETCDYNTSHKSHYVKHLSTDKCIFAKNSIKRVTKYSKSAESAEIGHFKTLVGKTTDAHTASELTCICGQTYKFKSGLSRHKTKCNAFINSNELHTSNNAPFNLNKELVLQILKQNHDILKENSELKNMMLDTQHKMMDVLEKGTHNTNSHNKTFNLQFFLNDTCKDAMNITDFVNNIQLQLSDLEKMGEVGYVNGISNIIVRNLKDMDIATRPIHCTDIKREVMYIKDEDKWDKDKNGNPKVRNAIKHIAHKNSKLLNEFKAKNPDYNNSSSKVSDKYNKLLIETMGGKGDNDVEKENKIIRNITKEIIVEKE